VNIQVILKYLTGWRRVEPRTSGLQSRNVDHSTTRTCWEDCPIVPSLSQSRASRLAGLPRRSARWRRTAPGWAHCIRDFLQDVLMPWFACLCPPRLERLLSAINLILNKTLNLTTAECAVHVVSWERDGGGGEVRGPVRICLFTLRTLSKYSIPRYCGQWTSNRHVVDTSFLAEYRRLYTVGARHNIDSLRPSVFSTNMTSSLIDELDTIKTIYSRLAV